MSKIINRTDLKYKSFEELPEGAIFTIKHERDSVYIKLNARQYRNYDDKQVFTLNKLDVQFEIYARIKRTICFQPA